jgi:hypothetical protein
MILRACSLNDGPQLIVVDALDECREPTKVIQHLLALADSPEVSLFASTRDEQDISELLRDQCKISLSTEVSSVSRDIADHVTWELAQHPKLSHFPQAIKEEILNALTAKANGM